MQGQRSYARCAGHDRRLHHYEFNGSAFSGSSLATATLMTNTSGGTVLGLEANVPDGHMLAIAVEPATPSSMIAVGSYATAAAPPLSTFEFTNGSDGTWVTSAAAAA